MRTRTKVVLAAPVVAGLVGGLGIGTILNTAPAHADANIVGLRGDHSAVGYAMELEHDGWVMTPAQALNNASVVCGQKALGESNTRMERELEDGRGMTFDQAFDMVYGAEFHFCPAYLPYNTGESA